MFYFHRIRRGVKILQEAICGSFHNASKKAQASLKDKISKGEYVLATVYLPVDFIKGEENDK